MLQLPCPPSPDIGPTGPGEQIFLFVFLYSLLLVLATLVMPKKWSARIVRIAFLREEAKPGATKETKEEGQ